MAKNYLKHALAVVSLCLLAVAARAEMPEIALALDGHKLTAEVAHTDATARWG